MQFFGVGFRGKYFLISKIITSVCFKRGKVLIKKNMYISTYKVNQNTYILSKQFEYHFFFLKSQFVNRYAPSID